MRILLIIPAYNEQENIEQTVKKIKEYSEEIKKSFNAPIVEGFEVFDSFGSYYDYSLDNPVTFDIKSTSSFSFSMFFKCI